MSNYIYGKNALREALLAKRVNKLYVTSIDALSEWVNLAKKNNVEVVKVSETDINNLIGKGKPHQGIVGAIKEYSYSSLDDIINYKNDCKYPLIIMLDGLEDPHNLGAILRTADAVSVNGIIIPKNRSVSLNDTVAKVSTGAIEYVKVCQVANLTQAINVLKEKGYWVVALELTDGAIEYTSMKYDMPTVLIIGSEGKGVSRLVLEQADYKVYLPMSGHVNSLNASVSASIMLYEINKYRKE